MSHEQKSFKRLSPLVVVLLAVVAVSGMPLANAAEPPSAPSLVFFETKIRPVLVKHCYECHSADAAKQNKLKAGLMVDSRAGLRRGGESGPALVEGKPEASLLIKSLRHDADSPEMPPNEKLAGSVIANFSEWIRTGAPDPREETAGGVATKKKGLSLEEGRKLWALQAPVKPVSLKVSDATWPRGEIDRFVLAKLDEQKLAPAADANPATWLRRVSFDLIGLPPSVDELESFLRAVRAERKNDVPKENRSGAEQPSPSGAYAAVVARLLESPRFGERWGRHWLDAARYADSNGRDRNVFWYSAWRYRDYVIDAFNADIPYDVFLREQIAGDLMPADSPAERDRLRIATGFLALGPKAFEEQKPEIFRMDVIDEQIDVIGRTVLGLSVACARCHDHKFDPIPTRDYYALAGIFRSTQPLFGYGPKGIKATNHHHSPLYAVGPEAEQFGEAGLAYIERLNVLTLTQNTARSDRYRVVRRVADAKLQIAKPGADKEKLQADIDRMEGEIKDWDVKVKAAENELKTAQENPPPMPGWAMGARDRDKPEDCRIHIRGETTNLAEVVPRGVLQVISLPSQRDAALAMPDDHSGRLELARWLTSPDNPLTARVYVNRIWQHLFGRGLVTTPDDFGVNGAPPSHPELLDYLATRLVALNWSTKQLLVEIVSSRTYQMATDSRADCLAHDPDNVYLWRMSPRRLEAEAIRDAILAIGEQLDHAPPRAAAFPVKMNPWQAVEYTNFQPQFTPPQIEHRHRSVYLPVVRGVLPTIFQVFDFAAPDRPIAVRDESTVPSQALYLMNNDWVIEQAKLLAEQLLADEQLDDVARLTRLYQKALTRVPTEGEVALARSYLAGSENLLPDAKTKKPVTLTTEEHHRQRWISYCQALFASAEFRVLR